MQPAAAVLDTTLVVGGLLIIGGAYAIHRVLDKRIFPTALPLLIALAGIGSVGVGVFNETFGIIHWLLSALLHRRGPCRNRSLQPTKGAPTLFLGDSGDHRAVFCHRPIHDSCRRVPRRRRGRALGGIPSGALAHRVWWLPDGDVAQHRVSKRTPL